MLFCANCSGQGVGDVIAACNANKHNMIVFDASMLHNCFPLEKEDFDRLLSFMKKWYWTIKRHGMVNYVQYLGGIRAAVKATAGVRESLESESRGRISMFTTYK